MHHLNADDVKALCDANRLMDFTHIWTKETGWKPKDQPYIPTPEEVNEWSLHSIAHHSINCSVVIYAECKRLGVDPICQGCHGEGIIWDNPKDKQAYDDWSRTEPPEGGGYQI